MNIRRIVFSSLLLVIVLTSGCGEMVTRRRNRNAIVEGGFLGAGLGALAGAAVGNAGAGAAIGAGAGVAAGAVVDVLRSNNEAQDVFDGPVPLPWIRGERVQVVRAQSSSGSWDDGLRSIIEDQLRAHGALVVTPFGRQWNRDEFLGGAYIIEFSTRSDGRYVVVDLRIINTATSTLQAAGRGVAERGYNSYTSGDFGYFADATVAAIENLH